jgi:shikimate dehydrogenase
LKPPISAGTRLLALLGDPVRHSLSPSMQNAAVSAAGLDGVYLALRVSAADLPSLLRAIAAAGGAGNVTIPHKELAAATLSEPTEAVRRTGACNTFWSEEGLLCGDNTDVAGFSRAARALLDRPLGGLRVLLLGAGGGARAAALAMIEEGAGEIVVLNRSRKRAEELVALFPEAAARLTVVEAIESIRGESFDLAVNATSLGLRPDDPLPLPVDAPLEYAAALDLVYAPGATPWIRQQQSRGVAAGDGLEMLLYQGAAAFERWWGVPAPLEAMRAAVTFS